MFRLFFSQQNIHSYMFVKLLYLGGSSSVQRKNAQYPGVQNVICCWLLKLPWVFRFLALVFLLSSICGIQYWLPAAGKQSIRGRSAWACPQSGAGFLRPPRPFCGNPHGWVFGAWVGNKYCNCMYNALWNELVRKRMHWFPVFFICFGFS